MRHVNTFLNTTSPYSLHNCSSRFRSFISRHSCSGHTNSNVIKFKYRGVFRPLCRYYAAGYRNKYAGRRFKGRLL